MENPLGPLLWQFRKVSFAWITVSVKGMWELEKILKKKYHDEARNISEWRSMIELSGGKKRQNILFGTVPLTTEKWLEKLIGTWKNLKFEREKFHGIAHLSTLAVAVRQT